MLELIHVNKLYKKHKVVDDLSFQLKAGEIVGLIGPNGAGKSTTVSMIATLVRPTSGQILFLGEDIVLNPQVIRKKLGFVPQDIALYESLTGYDNLIFWANAYHVKKCDQKERLEQVCEIIGCSNEMLHKKVKEYSGGMKRRLNIAVALLHQPKLVILDEPTVGIDIPSRKLILSAMECLKKKGTAILYIGHYMEEVEQLCDRILFMSHGKCILDGTLPEALMYQGKKLTLEQLYELNNV